MTNNHFFETYKYVFCVNCYNCLKTDTYILVYYVREYVHTTKHRLRGRVVKGVGNLDHV